MYKLIGILNSVSYCLFLLVRQHKNIIHQQFLGVKKMLNILVLLGLGLHSCHGFPASDSRKIGEVGLTSSNQDLVKLKTGQNGLQENLDNVS